ncbi:hypothetical protein SDC9_18814 [bioreactor metagenome]|uniref:Uncharacterized protein n=1 Tax=bioreactor metagenome TaxID=1076179 RepID=A0A644U3V3_9ZZZZ
MQLVLLRVFGMDCSIVAESKGVPQAIKIAFSALSFKSQIRLGRLRLNIDKKDNEPCILFKKNNMIKGVDKV